MLAVQPNGLRNSQKTFHKTFGTNCCPKVLKFLPRCGSYKICHICMPLLRTFFYIRNYFFHHSLFQYYYVDQFLIQGYLNLAITNADKHGLESSSISWELKKLIARYFITKRRSNLFLPLCLGDSALSPPRAARCCHSALSGVSRRA